MCKFILSLCFLLLATAFAAAQTQPPPGRLSAQLTQSDAIVWDNDLQLPSLGADSTANPGVAGAFSGLFDGRLIVAGGANFAAGLPAAGGSKQWMDDIYVYDKETGWTIFLDALPRPTAYGVSVTLPQGVLCIGGCDAESCFADVFLLSLNEGVPVVTEYPKLPVPLANAAGCMVNGKIYLAGGNESMAHPKATDNFFVFDPSSSALGWQRLAAWDGGARGYAVCAAQSDGADNCFYLFSGRNFDGDAPWTVYTDGYEYNPRLATWKKLECVFPVMAGCAAPFGTNHILFFGGQAPESLVGSNVLRLYHTVTNTLAETSLPRANALLPVTTNAVCSGNDIWIVSGETEPGVRTPVILHGRVDDQVHGMGWVDIFVIFIYFLSLAWIGWYFSKKQKDTGDYFKGGGRIPWFVVGLSIFGTSLSAITFMAIPAKAFATDWSYLLFNAGILLVVPLIVLVFIPFYRKLNVTTAYEYLELRFSPLVRVICSVAFIVFQLGRMAVVLLLPSIALNIVTGFDIFLCIGLMGVLSLTYTLMGGIEAVIWTEALQVVVLLGAAVAMVFAIANQLPDGMTTIFAAASDAGKFSLGSTALDLRQPALWTVLIATIFTNITTYGTDQTIVQRYLTTDSVKAARKGVYVNAALTVPASLLFFFLGTALWVFYKHFPQELSMSITDSDAILPWYMSTNLPVGLLGLVIAGLFAAAMSTLSSSMNSAATAFVTDIYRKAFVGRDEKCLLGVARWATFVLGAGGILFALVMASWDIKSLWDEFSKFLGILLGGLGGLFLLGLVTRRANTAGALCGLAGSVVVQTLVTQNQSVNLLLYSTTGFIACFVIGYVVSLLTGGSDPKHTNNLTIYKNKN